MNKRSITLSTKAINSNYDEYMFNRLQEYCYRMDIGIQAITINGRLHMQFVGRSDNLIELEQYLNERKGNER